MRRPRLLLNARFLLAQEADQAGLRRNAQVVCVVAGALVEARPHPHLLCQREEACLRAVH